MDGWSRLDDYNDRYIDRIWDESEEETFIQLAERDHGPTVAEIIQMLIRLDKGKKCTAIADGTDLYLTDDDRFIPDVMIVCDPDKIKSDGVHGASDLVVEVLSPSTMRND